MAVRIDPKKIMYDGTTASVRVGGDIDGQPFSIRVSMEYLTDKFRSQTVNPKELVQLAKNDLAAIKQVIERQIASGIAPQDVVVTTADI